MNDIIDKLEYIQIKIDKINKLHTAIIENYLAKTIDFNDTSTDSQLNIRRLCISQPIFTSLLESANDYIRQAYAEIENIIETAAQ